MLKNTENIVNVFENVFLQLRHQAKKHKLYIAFGSLWEFGPLWDGSIHRLEKEENNPQSLCKLTETWTDLFTEGQTLPISF